MELFIVFLIGFFSYWFMTRDNLLTKTISQCPNKEHIVRIAESCKSSKIKKQIKQYSLIKIQDGYYEYEEVLNALLKKEKDDKA